MRRVQRRFDWSDTTVGPHGAFPDRLRLFLTPVTEPSKGAGYADLTTSQARVLAGDLVNGADEMDRIEGEQDGSGI